MTTYLRIVQLPENKYAVQKREGGWTNEWMFCEANGEAEIPDYDRTWYASNPEFVIKYCVVGTIEKAEKTLEETLKLLREETLKLLRTKSQDPIKVIKVIKTVKI